MSRFLPLFPLNLVVFPGEKLNLHIFEMRYRQLITECHAQGTTFGIPVYLEKGLGDYGTEVKIISIEKQYATGEMDIKTQGLGIFKIKEFLRQAPNRLYPAGEIEDVTSLTHVDSDQQKHQEIRELLSQLHSALGILSVMLKLPATFTSYDVAHHLGFSTDQEYQLLQCLEESKRLTIILQHLRAILPVVQETERLKERVKLNGHFKNLPAPNF